MARHKDLTEVRRRCSNRDVRKVLVAVLKDGARYRMTKSGIMIYGPDGGTAVTHFSVSDRRGVLNLIADLRALGLHPRKDK